MTVRATDRRHEGATMKHTPITSVTVMLHACCAEPEFIVTHSDESHTIRLTPNLETSSIHVNGSLDELAKFVQDLANVVREINARELASAS